MYKKGTYISKIVQDLTVLAVTIINKNQLFLTDDNKWSENFFKELLNRIYGYQLINLNTKEANYAGIDLGDSTNRICVQITATNTSPKIKKTIATSKKYKRHKEYDTLVVLIIGYKKDYTTTFPCEFSNLEIWDIRNILEKISSLTETDQIQKLSEFIDKELEGVIKIDPMELLDEDISTHIDALSKYTQNELPNQEQYMDKRYKLTKRGEEFISQKNGLNNVDDLLFNNEIRPNLQYDQKIEAFLGNPINSEQQKKYFVITESLQKRYSENTEQFKNIGSLFSLVFSELATYENRKEVDGQKLLTLLHNMYFNCDIGNNPK